jgi:hypothetical protein
MHCCDSHLHFIYGLHKAGVDLNRDITGAALTHPHPQSSRFTPMCPSVVLWTPCSGVEWRVFQPTSGLERRLDVQAACEPGV